MLCGAREKLVEKSDPALYSHRFETFTPSLGREGKAEQKDGN